MARDVKKMVVQNVVLSRLVVESAEYKAINKLGFSSVKPLQIIIISEFINGRDVFVIS